MFSLKSNFTRDKNRNDGLFPQCKPCRKQYCKENCELIQNQKKKYYNKNRDFLLNQNKNYYNENRDKIIAHQKEYHKIRRQIDLRYKLVCNLRTRTSLAFRAQNVNKSNKTMELICCTKQFLKNWIQFQLYGDMTVENYGKIWQLDHTIPISSFNLSNENEKRKCFFWCNLRPMYVRDNIVKSNKVNMRLYLLQEIKARYFLRNLNEQEAR